MTRIVQIKIGQSHYSASVEEVYKAFNVGGRSSLLGMSVDPIHRPTVEQWMHDCAWQMTNTDGGVSEKWFRVGLHIATVLAASRLKHDENAGRAKK